MVCSIKYIVGFPVSSFWSNSEVHGAPHNPRGRIDIDIDKVVDPPVPGIPKPFLSMDPVAKFSQEINYQVGSLYKLYLVSDLWTYSCSTQVSY